MRSILRNMILATAGIAASFGTAAMAETLNVPFNFTVAGKTCPAGKYQVERTGLGGTVVTLRNSETQRSFNFVLRPGDPSPNDNRVVLSFSEAGPTGHSLNSVQYASTIALRLDKKTKSTERSAQLPMSIAQGQ